MNDDQLDAGGLPDFLRDPMGTLRRRWRWMALVVVLGLAATGAYVVSIPVRYLATATVLVSSQQIPESFIQSTVTETPFQRINALFGELTSRERLLDLEERHDIYPELRAKVSTPEVVQEVRANIELGTQRGLGPRSRGETSSIYSLAFRHQDPRVAAAVANDLASLFITASVRMRGQQARVTTEFMRTQLRDKEAELRAQEARITAFKEQYRGELPSELGGNLGKLDRLAVQRQTLLRAIADAETRLAMMTTNPEGGNSPAARLAALRGNLAAASAVYTDEHPNVLSLRRQIATLETDIAEGRIPPDADPTRQILLDAARRSLADYRAQLIRVEAELGQREQRVASTPKREEELGALAIEVGVLRDEYLGLLRKVEAAELAEKLEAAQQGERVSVLDRALPPSQPEKTRVRYLLAGSVASLALAMLLGLALEILDPVIFSASQIEDQFDLAVLGGVPRIS